jgi:hypothetical protein
MLPPSHNTLISQLDLHVGDKQACEGRAHQGHLNPLSGQQRGLSAGWGRFGITVSLTVPDGIEVSLSHPTGTRALPT